MSKIETPVYGVNVAFGPVRAVAYFLTEDAAREALEAHGRCGFMVLDPEPSESALRDARRNEEAWAYEQASAARAAASAAVCATA